MSGNGLQHIGIIMDGNRRWAKGRGLPVIDGHRAGFKNLKALLKTVRELEVQYLSVYAFSTENWTRAEEEVRGLMKLALWVLSNEVDELHKENIQLRFLGTREGLDKKLSELMDKAEEKTHSNDGGVLCICFNYGGKQEIIDAANAAVESGQPLTEESISSHVYGPDIPDVDLIIRTSGEKRISNFMMWRGSYAEIEFTDTLWPDFTSDELKTIVEECQSRNRRFGG